MILLIKNLKKRISNNIFTLRKIPKFLTFDSAVYVYKLKQTILPIVSVTGVLCPVRRLGQFCQLLIMLVF